MYFLLSAKGKPHQYVHKRQIGDTFVLFICKILQIMEISVILSVRKGFYLRKINNLCRRCNVFMTADQTVFLTEYYIEKRMFLLEHAESSLHNYALSEDAVHLRDPCLAKRNRCQNRIQHAGTQQCRIHPCHLHPRHEQGTGAGGGKNGKPAEAGIMNSQKSKILGRTSITFVLPKLF